MVDLEGVVFPFEDTGETPLALLPLAARRALDFVGFRLALEGYQSLTLDDRDGQLIVVPVPSLPSSPYSSSSPRTRGSSSTGPLLSQGRRG